MQDPFALKKRSSDDGRHSPQTHITRRKAQKPRARAGGSNYVCMPVERSVPSLMQADIFMKATQYISTSHTNTIDAQSAIHNWAEHGKNHSSWDEKCE